MKVAIMGAGLSGLSCAITLEKNGIAPTIFERRSEVGDRFVNGEAMLPVLVRPINNPLALLADRYGIYLKPLSNIRQIIIRSPNEQATLHGNLGFVNLRGRVENSFEKQLAKQVKCKIIFNSEHTYEELLGDFTHIVMATGDGAYAAKVTDYRQDLTVTLKGAMVEGKFDRYKVYIWLDNDLAPKGYGYLLPVSEREANITIAYPDYPENRKRDINVMWDKFCERVSRTLKQTLHITDRFEITRYIMGKCKYPRIGNTLFTGNCFGAINPAFGFGQTPSLLTGIYAAQALCGKGNYLKLTQKLSNSYDNSLVLRRTLELLENNGLNKLVKGLNSTVVQRLLTAENMDPLKLLSCLLRPVTLFSSREV